MCVCVRVLKMLHESKWTGLGDDVDDGALTVVQGGSLLQDGHADNH